MRRFAKPCVKVGKSALPVCAPRASVVSWNPPKSVCVASTQVLLLRLEEAAKGIARRVLVLSSATAVLRSTWQMTELSSASVSTVKTGVTNPKSEQGGELIEYQLL